MRYQAAMQVNLNSGLILAVPWQASASQRDVRHGESVGNIWDAERPGSPAHLLRRKRKSARAGSLLGTPGGTCPTGLPWVWRAPCEARQVSQRTRLVPLAPRHV